MERIARTPCLPTRQRKLAAVAAAYARASDLRAPAPQGQRTSHVSRGQRFAFGQMRIARPAQRRALFLQHLVYISEARDDYGVEQRFTHQLAQWELHLLPRAL